MVRKNIEPNKSIEVAGKYLTLTNVENNGAFLSMGNTLSQPVRKIVLTIIPLVFLLSAFIYLLFAKSISTKQLLGFCFILGGGIGNIFDRMLYGSVTDFLYMEAGIFHTGIFNMADLSIVIGVLIIFIHSFTKKNSGIDEASEITVS
jgi:signal peptidase II